MNIKKLIKSIYPALIVVLLYVVVTVLRSVGILNGYYIQVMMFAGINIMMTASLNLVNGFTGQFCIGHAGFMSLGAYGAAVITTMVFDGKNIPVVWPSPCLFVRPTGRRVCGCLGRSADWDALPKAKGGLFGHCYSGLW